MSSINILHLSDLHISSKRMSSTSKKLINDIVEQISKIDEVIVVVSGDIIDKGDYSKGGSGAKLFFETLKEKTEKKIKGIYIVPGNHDKERSVSNHLYGKLCQTKTFEITKEIWELQKGNYTSYLKLVSDIKKIFIPRCKQVNETFGIEYYECGNDVICFVEIDTSWGTYGGENENGKLVIGKHQLKCLYEKYEEFKEKIERQGKGIALTIGVAHHPTIWLNPDEEKLLKKYMIDDEYFNMDLYLCGHIHDMNIEHWYNSEHSVMTLVTGIGWNHQVEDSKDRDKKDEHRYSLYIIDTQKNSCDIVMRKSQKNGKFINDYSVYVNDKQDVDKLCFPLRIENNKQPFININSPNKEMIKSLFVDTTLMKKIKEVSDKMLLFQKKCVEIIMYYKREYIENLSELYDDKENFDEDYQNVYDYFFNGDQNENVIEKILHKSPESVYSKFTAFLQEVTTYFVKIFQESFSDNTNLRAHFRWYNQEKDEYCKLCQYSNVNQQDGPNISEIQWGGLIEQAFLLEKSLIYSANKNYNNHNPVKWDDFMTIVPSFFKSVREIRDSNHKKIKRPIITFGISVSNQNDKEQLSKVLYILEYLDLAQLITDILDDFVRYFVVDCDKYITYINTRR